MTRNRDTGSRASREKTSVLLSRMLAGSTGETVPLGLLLYRLRHRSFGGLFILFAALSLLPGISIFAGVLMIVPAVQMAIGLRSPALPRMVSEREISIAHLRAIGSKVIPWIKRIERFVKPRWLFLTVPPFTFALGLVVIVLAVIVTMPLPFSNFLPSISLLLLALGLLERDGIMIAAGLIVAVFATLAGGLIALLAFETIGSMLAD